MARVDSGGLKIFAMVPMHRGQVNRKHLIAPGISELFDMSFILHSGAAEAGHLTV